ncbi:MAG: subclass B1 metallo-beta-lactamase [Bacteroidetes bacterium]|nr:subclass B1 metallo-beta-lactamase [Bacteroidota bacterium]
MRPPPSPTTPRPTRPQRSERAARVTTLLALVFFALHTACIAQRGDASSLGEVYRSPDLVITRIAKDAFIHTSFKRTEDFGNVPCNGLIVRDGNEVIVFDTPTTDRTAEELIGWLDSTLHCRIDAVIPTHFHDDCLGGLQAFHDRGVPSYAHSRTIELAKAQGLAVPENGFKDPLVLRVGADSIRATFFGEGHTRDNIVVYFPEDSVLFGGCLVKEMGAGKGYLGDANVAAWSATVERVKAEYPDAVIVVPGHGAPGTRELLDYTIKLFKTD